MPVDVPASTCPFTCLPDSAGNFLGQMEESESQTVPHKKWKALRIPQGLSVIAIDMNALVLVAATGWMNANRLAYFYFKPMAVNGRKGHFCLLTSSSGKHRDHHNTHEISTIHYCWIMPANDLSTMPKLQNHIGQSCSTITEQLPLSNPLWCDTLWHKQNPRMFGPAR